MGNRARILGAVALAVVAVFSACSHAPTSSRPPSAPSAGGERSDSKLEALAQKAVEKTEEDERMAPPIQREINAIFFKDKDQKPGGLDAFAPDRIQELELDLAKSERPVIRYYVENREYFDRFEDAGGGFRVVSNAKRLVPHRWTKVGRRKLFVMDTARVREMIAHPCFAALEDCGEYASDGEENTALLDDWVKKYPEKEYQADRERVLRGYLAALEKYSKRVARGLPPKATEAKTDSKWTTEGGESPKMKRARQAAALVGTHIRGVESLLKD